MKRLFKFISIFVASSAILVIIIYAVAYVAVAQGWTDVEGEVDSQSTQYEQSYLTSIGAQELESKAQETPKISQTARIDLCRFDLLKKYAPVNAAKITETFGQQTDISRNQSRSIYATTLKLPELKNAFLACETGEMIDLNNIEVRSDNVFAWAKTEEWQIITEAITKDQDKINQAAAQADIDPRLLMTPLAVEQLRLYYSQREYYEKFFKPMKILVTTNQMAWGVMAIKERSAVQIENNLKDPNSPFYPGKEYEHLLDFSSSDINQERATRLMNEHDHYWSYIYGAVYIKELLAQWQKSGFPIAGRPEVIATLYNLGLNKSQPKAKPEVGGSTLEINGNKYTFGGLGFEIFYSTEMVETFPYLQYTSKVN